MPMRNSEVRWLRLDKFFHNHPKLYQWKLDTLKLAKRGVYRLLLADERILRLREEIVVRNNELIDRYVAGKKVLEIGCGKGTFLSSLSNNRNCDCVGIDVSQQMIEYARTKSPGPQYMIMDSSDLRFETKEFEVVVFNYVLHHVRDLVRTIAEAKRVARIIVIYESCAWERQPFKAFSQAYWKITDGGYEYLSLDEWQARFALPVLDEVRGHGLVRYGMCVLGT